ncbi:MAG: hypothetical protein A4E55_01799 [Pelotomaculum sp. PtaU1.Bin035]|nr:MAG: hypothetical protein A4E55_01799 [Pelotomaculum sp. PtaU1.Bin035]
MKAGPFNPVRKRLFIGLLSASLLGAGLFLTAIWYIAANPTQSIFDQLLLLALGTLLVGGIVVAGFGVGGIVLTILYARDISALRGPMRVAVNIFFPLALALGRFFHIDRDRIKKSFIEVNNFLVKSKALKLLPKQILLLAPHCLQKSDCPYKITVNMDNCHRCGGCVVSELLDLRDKYGINMGMATGGTLARKFVQEYHPRGIVAIACERDLTSGIQDSNPIPVLGLTNERPFGPCFNTRVKVPKVEEAICFFIREKGSLAI